MHGGDIYSDPNLTLDFSVNVNPLGMPDFVRAAIEKSLSDCDKYPDTKCRALREAVSACYGIDSGNIVFGNGAAELIFRIVQVKRPKCALLLAPSFYEYEAALASIDTDIRFFYIKEENDFVLSIEEYLTFLQANPVDMIFLCNPANPVGTVCSHAEMERILTYCKENGIFAVVDECFIDFLDEPEKNSVLDLAREPDSGIFLIQALTKSYAIAGLRLGFGFSGDKHLIRTMELAGQPWSVSVPAQAAGTAAFSYDGGAERIRYLEQTRELIRREKLFLTDGLTASGCKVYGSEANFLFFCDCSGKEEGALYEHFLQSGILIRSCESFRGLDGRFYRICVRRHEENEQFLTVLRDYGQYEIE